MAEAAAHLAFPLQVIAGRFLTVEEGSRRHLQDQADVICRTRPQTLDADPTFGLRELIARIPPAGPEILAALTEYIPEAEFQAHEEAIVERVRQVTVDLAPESTP